MNAQLPTPTPFRLAALGLVAAALLPLAARAQAPGGAALVVDQKGVAPSGPPDSFTLKFKATLQADARKSFDEPSRDNVLMRRVRPQIAGTVLGLVDFLVVPDFADSRAVLFDAFLDVHPRPWLRLRVGKFKTPLGLERLQTDFDIPFIERALTANLGAVRDVGAQLWGEVAGLFTYQLGVFDGAPDSGQLDQDTDENKDLAARLLVTPFGRSLSRLGNAGLGLAATTGQRSASPRAPGLLPLRTVGQTVFFAYLAPATDPMGTETVFASGRHRRLNPELYYFRGGLGVVAEAVWSQQEVGKGTDRAELRHGAWHATVSYVFGGRNGLDGATPEQPWNPTQGQLGALEVGLRYHRLDLDADTFPRFGDEAVSAHQAQGFGLAVNWVLSRLVRFAAGFEQTRFDGGGGAPGLDRETENTLFTRAQLNF
jgi:phosphate-selective porin OprO and OprP